VKQSASPTTWLAMPITFHIHIQLAVDQVQDQVLIVKMATSPRNALLLKEKLEVLKYMKIGRRNYLTAWQTPVSVQA